MKNAISKFIGIKTIMLCLLMTSLSMLSTTDMSGQSGLGEDLYSTPQGNFVDAGTAIIRLESELDVMREALSHLNPNSPAYIETEAKYAYYDEIRMILVDGKEFGSNATAAAIAGGFRIFGSEVFDHITKTQRLNFKQSAIDLLNV